jgi:hypothetical protein
MLQNLHNMLKLKHVIFLLPFFLSACKKEQLLNPAQTTSPVRFSVKGLVLTDTLEFTMNNKVLGQAIDNFEFPMGGGVLLNAGDKIQLRKKAGGKVIKEFEMAATPFNQVKKIFYDGTTLSDNITLTPVSNPDNMGFRFRFSTTFKDFYGGPVDLQLLDVDAITFDIVPLTTIKNVTGAFGDFIELPPLKPDHDYYFLVYKAGTEDLPYSSLENVTEEAQSNPYQLFIASGSFTKGTTQLLSISPFLVDGDKIGQGYDIKDLSISFK